MGADIVKRITINLKYTMDNVSYYDELKKINPELADNIAIQGINAIEKECMKQLEGKEYTDKEV